MLGAEKLFVIDPDTENKRRAEIEFGATSIDMIVDLERTEVDVCFVCSPSSLHIEHALAAARMNFHLFVEKPLSHSQAGLRELVEVISERNLTTMVGCNMRFHPGPRMVKWLIDENTIGRVLFSLIESGSFLPEWRPLSDFRTSYSAKAELGGGVLLDCIHEIDLAYWYSGDAFEVFSVSERMSLDIETEDVAMLIIRHSDGSLSNVHLDYVQRTYERGCKIVGDDGTIVWDFNAPEIKLYRSNDRKWESFPIDAKWQINDMYLDQTRHFLGCLAEKRETICNVAQAADVMRIALSAKESALSRTFQAVR